MAKNTSPDCKQCRREGCKLFLKGERCLTKCSFDKRPVAPGPHATARKKVSEYGIQLREKQKVRRAYGMLEKQFRNYYEKAAASKESTGFALLKMLELRLDNVIYRVGLGVSRAEARQIVNHGHITVNGKKVNIPSYLVKVGDEISVRNKAKEMAVVIESMAATDREVPDYIEVDAKEMKGKYNRIPTLADVPYATTMEPNLVIEFYSR